MTRTFTWAGLAAMGMLAAQGCVIVSGTGAGGSTGATTGSNTTSGNNTTTGSDTTTGSYTTTTGAGTSTSSGVIATSCDAVATDDTCTACEKKSCCKELEACNADKGCAATYAAYTACLFPNGTDASGYTTTYCQDMAGTQSPAGKASADPLIACLTTTCGNDTACGTPEKVTWDNFANQFVEDHCNGCHFPGFTGFNAKGEMKKVGPGATDIPQFTNDEGWQSVWGSPEANPDWQTLSSFDLVSPSMVSRKLWCGVSVTLPTFCAGEFSGHFPTAERFPPKGAPLDSVTAPSCQWTADGLCPQPTDVDRNKMASWVFDGTPKN